MSTFSDEINGIKEKFGIDEYYFKEEFGIEHGEYYIKEDESEIEE